MWVAVAGRCNRVTDVRDTPAYWLGRFDGRQEERARQEEQLRQTVELVQFLEQFPDPEFE